MLFPLSTGSRPWKKGEKASTRDTYLWKCSFESSTFKWDGFQLQAGKFFLGWMEKAGHCLDNGWLDFSLQKYCNISGHTNPFLPFLPLLIGFEACVCVSKGDESLVKIGWAWWPAVKFVAMPMEGGRVAISGKLIHSL